MIGSFKYLVTIPMSLGWAIISLRLARGEHIQTNNLFIGYQTGRRAVQVYATAFLTWIYILLWSLLLIVPGIIKAFEYSQVFYLIADNPNMTASEALKTSSQIMAGKKCLLFQLWLRFLGWAILCLLTLGIGFLWWLPYVHVSLAHFYERIRPENSEETVTVWTNDSHH